MFVECNQLIHALHMRYPLHHACKEKQKQEHALGWLIPDRQNEIQRRHHNRDANEVLRFRQ